jgi:hypothetical protein
LTTGGAKAKLEQLAATPEHPSKKDWPTAIQLVDRTSWKAWFEAWFQQMDITTQPIGAEALQEMMLQEGVRPEENMASRGIIAMREE